jgi:hypothetical protein
MLTKGSTAMLCLAPSPTTVRDVPSLRAMNVKRAAAAIKAAAATPIHKRVRRLPVRALPPDDRWALASHPVSPIPLTRDATALCNPRRSSRTAATDS